MITAVIPARGGSKRIPRKNVLRFGGKPMLVWTIEAAIYSNLFDKIVVSTDDWEIAGIAEEAGADVPFTRDAGLADDYATISDVVIDAISRVGGDTICMLSPACPFRTHQDVIDSYEQFSSWGGPAQISVSNFGWMKPKWAVDRMGIQVFQNEFGRSQDLPELWHPTGAIWWAQATSLIINRDLYMRGRTTWEIPWERALDIDTPEDLALAKTMLRGREV